MLFSVTLFAKRDNIKVVLFGVSIVMVIMTCLFSALAALSSAYSRKSPIFHGTTHGGSCPILFRIHLLVEQIEISLSLSFLFYRKKRLLWFCCPFSLLNGRHSLGVFSLLRKPSFSVFFIVAFLASLTPNLSSICANGVVSSNCKIVNGLDLLASPTEFCDKVISHGMSFLDKGGFGEEPRRATTRIGSEHFTASCPRNP
jgi:hypothetical protein